MREATDIVKMKESDLLQSFIALRYLNYIIHFSYILLNYLNNLSKTCIRMGKNSDLFDFKQWICN
jgi:hypothetical protein